MSIHKSGQVIKIYRNEGYIRNPTYLLLIHRKKTIPKVWKGSKEVWWAMDIQKGDKHYYRLDNKYYTAEVINDA
jgi:hypothetical protein